MAGQGDEDFAFFSLAGERFEAPGMPTDAAAELIRFRDAVYAVARTRWLVANPDRKNVPNGFDAAFDLRLVGVDSGSARPRINMHRSNAYQGDEYDSWFENFRASRDQVVFGLAAVATSNELPADFPREDIKLLQRLGGTLAAGDGISIGPPGATSAPKVMDVQVRQTLRNIDLVTDPDTIDVDVEGVITEFDGERQSFVLRRASDGVRLACAFPGYESGLARTVKSVLAEDGVTAPDVVVRGRAEPGARGTFTRIHGVWEVEIVRAVADKLYVTRMGSLRALEVGWWGEESLPPDPAVLALLDSHRQELTSAGADVSMVAHTDGAVELEWSRGDLEYTALLGADGSMALFIDNLSTDELAETVVRLTWGALWQFLTDGTWA